jgi:hypothetical protein
MTKRVDACLSEEERQKTLKWRQRNIVSCLTLVKTEDGKVILQSVASRGSSGCPTDFPEVTAEEMELARREVEEMRDLDVSFLSMGNEAGEGVSDGGCESEDDDEGRCREKQEGAENLSETLNDDGNPQLDEGGNSGEARPGEAQVKEEGMTEALSEDDIDSSASSEAPPEETSDAAGGEGEENGEGDEDDLAPIEVKVKELTIGQVRELLKSLVKTPKGCRRSDC